MDAKNIATNKKAFRDYTILDKFECGIELRGSEVKSLRGATASFADSFARIENNEVLLYNMYMAPYLEASYLNVDSVRVRRLLLHRAQIRKLTGQVTQRGLTLVPLRAYFNKRGIAKIELGLCKGKKSYDKRRDFKRKEGERELRRVLKSRRK